MKIKLTKKNKVTNSRKTIIQKGSGYLIKALREFEKEEAAEKLRAQQLAQQVPIAKREYLNQSVIQNPRYQHSFNLSYLQTGNQKRVNSISAWRTKQNRGTQSREPPIMVPKNIHTAPRLQKKGRIPGMTAMPSIRASIRSSKRIRSPGT